jgi:RNA polymerase sigma factor (sigma-70 family)
MNAEAADAVLWDSMRSGDLDSWGFLFERYSSRVYRFCVRFLGSSQEAEEVLSEAFLEVWRSRRSFVVRDDSALPILLAIARRACQKRTRSLQRLQRKRPTTSPQLVSDIADQVVDDDEVDRQRDWLRKQVSSLPVQFRDVFELIVYAELPYGDVSRVLQVPVGTVKSRMARGRRMLEENAQIDLATPARQHLEPAPLQSLMRGPRA